VGKEKDDEGAVLLGFLSSVALSRVWISALLEPRESGLFFLKKALSEKRNKAMNGALDIAAPVRGKRKSASHSKKHKMAVESEEE
jgi:hypothetical protein